MKDNICVSICWKEWTYREAGETEQEDKWWSKVSAVAGEKGLQRAEKQASATLAAMSSASFAWQSVYPHAHMLIWNDF